MQLNSCTHYNTIKEYSDLYIVSCGREGKNPEHSFGPIFFENPVLQYMTYGKGSYTISGKTYPLKKGDMFFIPKDKLVYYESDKQEPYSYYWLVLGGKNTEKLLSAAKINEANPVIPYNDENISFAMDNIIYDVKLKSTAGAVSALGNVYKLFSLLIKNKTLEYGEQTAEKVNYVTEAMFYIHDNYYKNITVETISEHLGLNRTYFSTLFKKQANTTPVDYLISYRISEATKLLRETDLSVNEIAVKTGFESAVNFYMRFKQRIGIPPKDYRKSVRGKKTTH